MCARRSEEQALVLKESGTDRLGKCLDAQLSTAFRFKITQQRNTPMVANTMPGEAFTSLALIVRTLSPKSMEPCSPRKTIPAPKIMTNEATIKPARLRRKKN